MIGERRGFTSAKEVEGVARLDSSRGSWSGGATLKDGLRIADVTDEEAPLFSHRHQAQSRSASRRGGERGDADRCLNFGDCRDETDG